MSRSPPSSSSHELTVEGLRDGEAADDRALRDRQRAEQSVARPQASAELDLEPRRVAHPLDERQILRLAALGAVEVDDVQPARAGVAIARGKLDRVELVARLAIEVAAQQPYAASVADVDRRYQVPCLSEGCGYIFTKLSSTCAPTRAERSG